MKRRQKAVNSELISTIIGEDCEFRGSINTQRSIRIEGTLEEGNIISHGEVYIGEKSRVKGNIVATRIVVAGEVIGNIETTNGLHIKNTGKVYGDIKGDQLLIEEGAIYKGKVNMDVIASKSIYEGSFTLAKVS